MLGAGYGMLSDINPNVGGAFAFDKSMKARQGQIEADRKQTRMGWITGRQTLLHYPMPKAQDYGTPPSYFNATPTPEYSQMSNPPVDFIKNPPMTKKATGRTHTRRRRGGETVGTY